MWGHVDTIKLLLQSYKSSKRNPPHNVTKPPVATIAAAAVIGVSGVVPGVSGGATGTHDAIDSNHSRHPLGGAEEKDAAAVAAATLLDARTNTGSTALHYAAANGQDLAVEALLAAGAQVSAFNSTGTTALHEAAYHGKTRVMAILVRHGANVEAKEEDGWFPLLYAASGRMGEGVREARRDIGMDYDDDDIAEDDDESDDQEMDMDGGCGGSGGGGGYGDINTTKLAGRGSRNTRPLRILLAANADVHATNPKGWTALHEAALHGNDAAVHLLVERGIDPNCQTMGGSTPLAEAAFKARSSTIQTLLALGAGVDMANHAGFTALHRAAGSEPSGAFDDATAEVIGALLGSGARREATTAEGETPLMLARRVKNEVAVALLLGEEG